MLCKLIPTKKLVKVDLFRIWGIYSPHNYTQGSEKLLDEIKSMNFRAVRLLSLNYLIYDQYATVIQQ